MGCSAFSDFNPTSSVGVFCCTAEALGLPLNASGWPSLIAGVPLFGSLNAADMAALGMALIPAKAVAISRSGFELPWETDLSKSVEREP
jgi:hypothetical protein